MNGGALMRVVGMCGGEIVLRTWRPPVAQAEVGPYSNAVKEKRADPSLTLLRKARKHVKSRTHFGSTDSRSGAHLCAVLLAPDGVALLIEQTDVDCARGLRLPVHPTAQ